MKFKYTPYKDGTGLTISREFDPGEKYITACRWNRKDGTATAEKVERMIPGSRFVGVRHNTVWSPKLERITVTSVLVERTYGQ